MYADPLQQRYRLHNLIEEWRAQLGQSLFLLGVGVVFLSFLLIVVDPFWPRLLASTSAWSGARVQASLALMAAVLIALIARRRARRLASLHSTDWLAAMPIPQHLRTRFRRSAVLRAIVSSCAILLTLLAWGQARVIDDGWIPLGPMLIAGVLGGLLLSVRSAWVPTARVEAAALARPLAAAVVACTPHCRALDAERFAGPRVGAVCTDSR